MYFETVYVHNYVCIHMAKKLNLIRSLKVLKVLRALIGLKENKIEPRKIYKQMSTVHVYYLLIEIEFKVNIVSYIM